jgi:gag-polyprotein putative aspartyl protease
VVIAASAPVTAPDSAKRAVPSGDAPPQQRENRNPNGHGGTRPNMYPGAPYGAGRAPYTNSFQSQGAGRGAPGPGGKPNDAAYRVRADAQEDGLVEEVAAMVKASPISITFDQLLGLSPDLRRYFRSYNTARRVPANFLEVGDPQPGETPEEGDPVEALLMGTETGTYSRTPKADSEDSPRIVGQDWLSLRVLECECNGVSFEGILDEGSTVVVISKDLWRRLGSPLDPFRARQMSDANGGSAITEGQVPNLPFTVAGVTFYLQVQVVDKAPFDCLLGRPFYALAHTTSISSTDGTSTITIQDPNRPEHVLVVPTKERTPGRRKPAGQTQGF